EDHSVAPRRDPRRLAKRGFRGLAVAIFGIAGTSDCRHLTVERHTADAVVAGVGHEQRPVSADRDSAGRVEPRLGATPVAASRLVAARDRANAPALDRADAVVVGVGDEDHAFLIDRDADRAVEARLLRSAVGEAALAGLAGDKVRTGRSNVNS